MDCSWFSEGSWSSYLAILSPLFSSAATVSRCHCSSALISTDLVLVGSWWLSFGATLQPFYMAYGAYSPDASDPAAGLKTAGFNSGFGISSQRSNHTNGSYIEPMNVLMIPSVSSLVYGALLSRLHPMCTSCQRGARHRRVLPYIDLCNPGRGLF